MKVTDKRRFAHYLDMTPYDISRHIWMEGNDKPQEYNLSEDFESHVSGHNMTLAKALRIAFLTTVCFISLGVSVDCVVHNTLNWAKSHNIHRQTIPNLTKSGGPR